MRIAYPASLKNRYPDHIGQAISDERIVSSPRSCGAPVVVTDGTYDLEDDHVRGAIGQLLKWVLTRENLGEQWDVSLLPLAEGTPM
jgi:hypothetical protein